MSEQKFTATNREAIWLAHEKKCAYTRELLDLSNVHIDHIVPEKFALDPSGFAKLRAELVLAEDFDLYGFENLLPCKPGANLQKGAATFEPARINYFLGIAASKKSEIERHSKAIKDRQVRGRALVLLQQGLERGQISPEEVSRLLEIHADHPQEIFRLMKEMKFADGLELTTIAKASIEDLRNRQVKFGPNDHIDSVMFVNDKNEEVAVRTCREYDAAIRSNYWPRSNTELKLSVFLRHQCGLLTALERAQTPVATFVARVGITDLDLIPYSLFPQIGDAPVDSQGITYQGKVNEGALNVKRIKQNMLVIEDGGMGQQLIEVARADFDGDGIEDILLFEYCYAIGGTLGFGGIRILTRKEPGGLFKIVS